MDKSWLPLILFLLLAGGVSAYSSVNATLLDKPPPIYGSVNGSIGVVYSAQVALSLNSSNSSAGSIVRGNVVFTRYNLNITSYDVYLNGSILESRVWINDSDSFLFGNDSLLGSYSLWVVAVDDDLINYTSNLASINFYSNSQSTQTLCPNVSNYWQANLSYINMTSLVWTQYNITMVNQTTCTYNITCTGTRDDVEARINASNPYFKVRCMNTNLSTSWTVLYSCKDESRLVNCTLDAVNVPLLNTSDYDFNINITRR